MRIYLIPAVFLLMSSASGLAADLPLRGPLVPPEADPEFTWTGFYAGANSGYGFADFRNRGIALPAGSVVNSPGTAGTLTVRDGTAHEDGFVGGGQIGYNHQFGDVVVGLEADAQYRDFGRRSSDTGTYVFAGIPGAAFSPPLPGVGFRNPSSAYFGTVRGRLGYAFDRVLVYATAGLGYDSDNVGWTAGGGVEYAFAQNMSVKIEALYVDLDGGRRVNPIYSGAATNRLSLNDPNTGDFVVARAGLNVKFDSF